jgi:hypothetical protein
MLQRARIRVDGGGAVLGPCVTVIVFSVAIAAAGMRGADYPAHLLRALLWDRSGISVWNNYWYGGHSTPTYSIVTPPLTAALGIFPVVAVSSIAAVYWFARLTTTLLPGRSTALANHAFALGAVVNVIVGRAPFAVGLAIALAALWIWGRHPRLAVLLAFATPLASPVAATYLATAAAAVAVTAWWPSRRTGPFPRLALQASGIAVATIAPILAMAMLFPSPGRFPFRGDQFVFSLIAVALIALVHRSPTIRVGCALVAAASSVLFLVPNPLGGNFLRLTQMAALPLLVIAWPTIRAALAPSFAALLVAGAVWTVHPGVGAALQWVGDESVHADFHEPLIEEVRMRNSDGRPVGRLEVPFTDNHWESYYVAPEVPFARGWERQVDLDRNGVLYEDDLTVAEYHDWLLDNAVRWIAVADVDLDEGGAAEGAVMAREDRRQDIPWVRLVWRNDDWRLYEVLDYVPIIEPPARLLDQTTDTLTIRTDSAAVVTLHYQYSAGTTIDGGACLTEDENGWILAALPAPGDYAITVEAGEALEVGESDVACSP